MRVGSPLDAPVGPPGTALALMNEVKVVAALAALAHENRLRIFRLLVKKGSAGMPSTEIAKRAGMGPSNTSFHLKELGHAGLLRSTRNGRFVNYAIDVESTRKLLAFLMQECVPPESDR